MNFHCHEDGSIAAHVGNLSWSSKYMYYLYRTTANTVVYLVTIYRLIDGPYSIWLGTLWPITEPLIIEAVVFDWLVLKSWTYSRHKASMLVESDCFLREPTMMVPSNRNIFRVTGLLCGEFTGYRWIPHIKASDAELSCFFYLRLNKRLSKQSWGWWSETPSRPLLRHCNVMGPVSDWGFDLEHSKWTGIFVGILRLLFTIYILTSTIKWF